MRIALVGAELHDGVHDELPGAVISDAAAPAGGRDGDAAPRVLVALEAQVRRGRGGAEGNDGFVLDEEHRVGDRVADAVFHEGLLEREGFGVG